VSAEEILADVRAAYQLPAGHAKAQRFEVLAERAREADDRRLEAEVLLGLSDTYSLAAEQHKQPAVFGRVLWLLDQFPDAVGPLSHNIHWQLKWLTVGLLTNPDVPLSVTYKWFDELEQRYRQRGHSLRPVHALRASLSRNIGDTASASAQLEASIAAPRDEMADCQACEHSDMGGLRADLGDDDGALEYWAPVLDGTFKCRAEPHQVLGKAALPLLRAGRVDEARSAFLVGYSLARQKIGLVSAVGQHIEFCALTGNEARGLEILAEHQGWLSDLELSASERLGFISGVAVLLRRLTALGHGSLPAGASQTVTSLSAKLDEEIRSICARFDARNGNSAVSDRADARLRREPLVDHLPLGLPSRLPAVSDASAAVTRVADTRESGTSLDELIVRARDLAEKRHPGAGEAWARVAATSAAAGQELPVDVAAQVARSSAGRLVRTDPAAAHAALLEVARRFAELDDLDRELEARASAAHALLLAGNVAGDNADGDVIGNGTGDRATIGAVREEAMAAFAAGKLTPRYYLNVLLIEQHVAGHTLETAAERPAADVDRFSSGLESVLALAEQHGQAYHAGQCHELRARVAYWRRDRDALVRHLGAARESFLAAGMPWFAVQAEANLGEFALHAGDPQQAESYARDALAHAIDIPPEQAAMLASLRANALSQIQDRAAEFADASLTAAARWDGISEPDTLHNTFNAARAYARLGRHAEAAALFAEAMPKVDVPYDQTGIAQTRELYARSLRALGRHRDAAEQFLETARLIADDTDNARAHAAVAADAARELQDAGQEAEAVAAFQRAAELFGELGNTVARVRCQRSAAWVQFRMGDDCRRAGVTTMRSVLSSLESLAQEGSATDELAGERDNTVEQLDRMLKIAAEESTPVD
jgi:tetratricopeptide (TPR) repeat protein